MKTSPSTPLRRCPFCGSTQIYTFTNDDNSYVAACKDCDAQGPDGKKKFEVIARWQSRPIHRVQKAKQAIKDFIRSNKP